MLGCVCSGACAVAAGLHRVATQGLCISSTLACQWCRCWLHWASIFCVARMPPVCCACCPRLWEGKQYRLAFVDSKGISSHCKHTAWLYAHAHGLVRPAVYENSACLLHTMVAAAASGSLSLPGTCFNRSTEQKLFCDMTVDTYYGEARTLSCVLPSLHPDRTCRFLSGHRNKRHHDSTRIIVGSVPGPCRRG